ncbi:MAG: alginate lyase family protein [Sulfuricaulis sp.]|uniref:alginate lyase family protein n=1 Tax=Sulfuricaulis sp. TaxID=2003553 RepID=UPI0034A488E6
MTSKLDSRSTMVWYWTRLRRMSPSEIGYRIRVKCASLLQKMGIGTAGTVPQQILSKSVVDFIGSGHGSQTQPYIDAADKILQGKLRIFALKHVFGHFPQWNQDPKTGTVAPLVFSKSLDYRNESLVGDIKYLWELNRHLHLVTLAQAYRLSKDQRYLDGLQSHLASWFDQCPYLRGPNWTSSLELAIRLINWSIAWQLIGGIDSLMFSGDAGKKFRERWLATIYQHMHFIRRYYSRFSSANNHLIGEAAGVFIGSITWPYWNDTQDWGSEAQAILEREVLLQNTPDGVNREQAISYQQFVLDFLIIAALAGQANNCKFPNTYWKRIEAMLEFLASIMDAGGHVPMIGDADDGYVTHLSQEPGFCPYRSLLATGAVLFGRGDFKAKSAALDDKTRWLLGDRAEPDFNALRPDPNSLPIRRAFPEGGYYILGADFETEREIKLIVDAGPLGYLSLAAHGHADALSLTLSVGGREFLIDPGTYAYHTSKAWRDYFRGTSAHNTVVVDGQDQSVIGGNFMWAHHAQAKCEAWEPGENQDRFVGEHTGYQRLSDPVTHRRSIVFDKRARVIEIEDNLLCRDEHVAETHWNVAETCEVSLERDGSVLAVNGKHKIRLISDGRDAKVELRRGEEDLIGGWVSRRFDVKSATTTVVWRSRIFGDTQLQSRIEILD